MNILRILAQIAILFAFSFIGGLLHTYLHIPLPGSIIGLILLFLALCTNFFSVKWIDQGAGFLLAFLPFLFIPTLIGVINYPELLSNKGFLLLIVVVISTIITIGAAGRASQYSENKSKRRKEEKS